MGTSTFQTVLFPPVNIDPYFAVSAPIHTPLVNCFDQVIQGVLDIITNVFMKFSNTRFHPLKHSNMLAASDCAMRAFPAANGRLAAILATQKICSLQATSCLLAASQSCYGPLSNGKWNGLGNKVNTDPAKSSLCNVVVRIDLVGVGMGGWEVKK